MKTIHHTPGNAHAPPIERLMKPIQHFIHTETSGGILLLIATVAALIWANSPWGAAYAHLWQIPFRVGAGDFVIDKALILWINDGLMAIFFFVVGLEIKREIQMGELSSLKQASLPIAAAIGGMVIPAAFYMLVNAGGEGAGGWGIPMATDIAFALGVLALLGNRVPLSIKIFLTALAIVDDMGAVLVIALFYTAQISWGSLAIGALFLVALLIINRLGVRAVLPYLLLGVGLWVAFLKSGVHATIAGVLLAMTIPGRPRIDAVQFETRIGELLSLFRLGTPKPADAALSEEQQVAVHEMGQACLRVESPMHRLEHGLHPWVMFLIIPVFALANAGVQISGGNISETLFHPVSLGIILGLFAGKQLGITLFSWLAVRLGLAEMPEGVTWRHIYGTACLGGIGFTMSLFIANLGFPDSALLDVSKIGILVASLISGILGWIILMKPQGRA